MRRFRKLPRLGRCCLKPQFSSQMLPPIAAPRAFRSNGRFQEAAPSLFLTTQKAAERGSCFAGLRPGAQAEGKTRETANGRKAACLKSYRALQLKPVRIWIFDGIGNRLIPARDFFLEKKQKRAVLGLAEPVHPLPHLPRQSRLFGRRFRLHPPCGGRGMLFEYRAACSNPALALRMRAIGAAQGAR